MFQGKDVDYSKPFENEAIVQTIHQEFFSYCSKAIDKDYPERFPGARNSWKLSNTTIALAATGVSIAVQSYFIINKLSRYVQLWTNGNTAVGGPCHLQQIFIQTYMWLISLPWQLSSKRIARLIKQWFVGSIAVSRMLKYHHDDHWHVLIFIIQWRSSPGARVCKQNWYREYVNWNLALVSQMLYMTHPPCSLLYS